MNSHQTLRHDRKILLYDQFFWGLFVCCTHCTKDQRSSHCVFKMISYLVYDQYCLDNLKSIAQKTNVSYPWVCRSLCFREDSESRLFNLNKQAPLITPDLSSSTPFQSTKPARPNSCCLLKVDSEEIQLSDNNV